MDDSENIAAFHFNMSSEDTKTFQIHQSNMKQAGGDTSILNNKHLFGMGYPYFICGYDKHVAVSTDYGICLFKFGV